MTALFSTTRAWLAATFIVVAFGLTSCATTSTDSRERPPCCREIKSSAPIPDQSLYQLDSQWTSDQGRVIRLGNLQGQPQVIAMIFTSCEFACPIIVNDMKRISDALSPEVQRKVNFTLISFDHERDTPERLLAFRKRMGLPMAGWTLLRGEADDVRELAALLGVNYRKDARGQYAHSNLITVLNAQGEIVAQESGLNIRTEGIAEKITAAAK